MWASMAVRQRLGASPGGFCSLRAFSMHASASAAWPLSRYAWESRRSTYTAALPDHFLFRYAHSEGSGNLYAELRTALQLP